MNSIYYDLYGSTSDDIERKRLALERAFSVEAEARESSYVGCYYTYKLQNGEELRLTLNYQPWIDDEEDRWIDERFKSYAMLLYVTSSQPMEFERIIRSSTSDFVILERVRFDTVNGVKTEHEMINKSKS